MNALKWVLEWKFGVVAMVVALTLLQAAAPNPASAEAPALAGADDTPVLAYYYIWYTEDSWERAKSDIPLLGAYSSDDEAVMREHIRWAKAAGIDGFIVCWKDSESLTRRLTKLVEIAREESFLLAINYESLDFSRNPLSPAKVAADLGLFAEMYAEDPVFGLYDRPVVIWSGTWKFSREEIEQVTQPLRDRLMILGSQKKVGDYLPIADLLDGNAYYWSSVDPSTYPDYAGKLQEFGAAVHANGGIWIAPAAPGFDARHLGGERSVDRLDGAMLETQLATALSSAPDAIGLISWNEFSENTHIEPSCIFGDRYVSLIAGLIGGETPNVDAHCNDAALATAQAGTDADTSGAAPVTPVTAATGVETLSFFDWDSSAPEGRTRINGADFRVDAAEHLRGHSAFASCTGNRGRHGSERGWKAST
jgi:hypothetical protein